MVPDGLDTPKASTGPPLVKRPSDYHVLPDKTVPTALQKHVSFWDRDNDNIISTTDVYTGFRELGFSIPFSIAALLINVFFSYPTRLGHSYLPDPYFRICVNSINKAKHGSDTGIYDLDGNFRPDMFEKLFTSLDTSGTGSLGVAELFELVKKDRVAADPAGWSFAAMEWWTTWLLLQRGGRAWHDDLRAVYDGTLFFRISEQRREGQPPTQGDGIRDGIGSLIRSGAWEAWEGD